MLDDLDCELSGACTFFFFHLSSLKRVKKRYVGAERSPTAAVVIALRTYVKAVVAPNPF